MTRILLGFNCNCFTNRYDEPGEWPRLCAEMGVHYVMFSMDLIDPYWPWDLQRRLADETLDACVRHGVNIRCAFGGHHHHQHYLGHPDDGCRQEAERFFRRAMRLTAYLGGTSFGTLFGMRTVRCQDDPNLRSHVFDQAVAAYHRLAEYGAGIGLTSLAYEVTSVPRESCATFAENDEVLDRCADMAIPIRLCLDLGHRYLGGSQEESDSLAWIRRYGLSCDVIDCQQTDRQASRHWPFTGSYNDRGVIRGDEVVEAIGASGSEEVMLAFEIRTAAFHPQEYAHLEALRASVGYWRQWVRD
jgi:sugar phosphate isomerase/epimerase